MTTTLALNRFLRCALIATLPVWMFDIVPNLALADEGVALFAEHCASCHGDQGQGVKDVYTEPLTGDKSVKELSRYLHTSMPDGSPEDVQGDEAEAVAKYIYDAFYSPVAQARNAPATVEVSRLTGRQIRHSIIDAINIRCPPRPLKEERGMQAVYFNDDKQYRFNPDASYGKKPVVKRVEPTLDFLFSRDIEKPDAFNEDKYAVHWLARLYAPETGRYEFQVDTSGGFKLYVNDPGDPLIDQYVQSGDATTFTASVDLVGGRYYPVHIEMKGIRKDRPAPKRGQRPKKDDNFTYRDTEYLKLQWKPPGGVRELIPQRLLVPGWGQQLPIVATPFPPDDASTGYDRGTSVSQEWLRAVTRAAIEASQVVADDVQKYAKINRKTPKVNRPALIRDYVLEVAERAYRRPLTKDEKAAYQHLFNTHPTLEAVQLAAIKTFTSPHFLYREAGVGSFDSHAAAAWISYAFWDSVPDIKLTRAASNGQVTNESQLRRWSEHALNDPRAKAKLRGFFRHWLRVEQFHGLDKDNEAYPDFDEHVVADLQTSLELFLDDIVWGDDPSFRQLLTSRDIYLNTRLADLYAGGRADLFPDTETPARFGPDRFYKVSLDGEPRAGLLSHPYLMAGFSYDRTTSPIHRGVFLSRSILGRILKAPQIDVMPVSPDLSPELTTRQRVHQQTSSTTCMSCHSMINPLGFALENFDEVGRYRTRERDREIDASGVYIDSTGRELQFQNMEELAREISLSDEARAAFVSHLFHDTIKQPILAFGGLEYRDQLVERFRQNDHDIRKLWVDIVVSSATVMHQRDKKTPLASPTP